MYKLLRSLLFLFSPETAHHVSMKALNLITGSSLGSRLIRICFQPHHDEPVTIGNVTFRHPLGLAAGFDKNAKYLHALDCLGFSHVEIGTVTPVGQEGNPKPRLFRLPKDKALINRMGFNNDGVQAVAENIKAWRKRYPNSNLIIGGNIGKNKVTPNEDAWKDYVICFQHLYPLVDYFTINVSSPNTPGLRALQDVDSLKIIMEKVMECRHKETIIKPIFLKIAPDLSNEAVLDIANLVQQTGLNGMIIANTTISRDNLKTDSNKLLSIGAGGLSGAPLQQRSRELTVDILQNVGTNLHIITSGGVFTKEEYHYRISKGAKLVQVWTGFIYEGPSIIKKLLQP